MARTIYKKTKPRVTQSHMNSITNTLTLSNTYRHTHTLLPLRRLLCSTIILEIKADH